MSLDWGNGFGTSFHNDSEIPKSLRNLCFFDAVSKTDTTIPLFIDKRRLLCAQIPGVHPEETYFVDLLELHPESSMIVIDFISYERVFLNDMQILHQQIISKLGDTKFSRLQRTLSDLLQQLISNHESLLKSIEELAKQHSEKFLAQFIEKLSSNPSILQSHRDYLEKYLQNEPTAVSLSMEESFSYRELLGGRVLIQLMRSPIKWQDQAVKTANALATTLPANIDKSRYENQLAQFAAKIEDLTQTIDSIPKLEQISKLFITEPFPIIVQGRRLLKKGQAKKRCRSADSRREIILFSDMFIYVQSKGGRYFSPASYDLTHLEVKPRDGQQLVLLFYAPKKSFVMLFSSIEEREAWQEALEVAIQSAKENCETPIEKYRPAPIWIQDKEEKACMNCKSLFTTFNRRHHCRGCGFILCGDCLKRKMVLPGISDKKVRVCERCYHDFFGK